MKYLNLDDDLYGYVLRHTRPALALLERLADETRILPQAGMQISPDQGAFLHLLVKLIGATRCLEIGCFTGYSALCIASALPEGGTLVTLDVNHETTGMARRYFREAGLDGKIDLRLGPALDALPTFEDGTFDLAFIDADKESIVAYYEHAVRLVRAGGLILVDNVLWDGRVADVSDQTPATVAIRAVNERIEDDDRVDHALLSLSDGLFVIRKR